MEGIITKTRKNRISKRQRVECFMSALPSFLKAAEKYKPINKKPDGARD